MQQITDLLRETGGLESIARELGLSESQAASGAAALLPALLGGFKKQAKSQPAGLDGLVGMLSGLGGSGMLDEVLAPRPTNVKAGNDVLGEVFGSKDVSRTVAQNAAARSGLDPTLLSKMLPVLAMLVAGYMAKNRATPSMTPSPGGALGGGPVGAPGGSTGGGLGDLLGGLLGGGQRGGSAGGALGGLASMLDLDGDGNPLEDILDMARGRR